MRQARLYFTLETEQHVRLQGAPPDLARLAQLLAELGSILQRVELLYWAGGSSIQPAGDHCAGIDPRTTFAQIGAALLDQPGAVLCPAAGYGSVALLFDTLLAGQAAAAAEGATTREAESQAVLRRRLAELEAELAAHRTLYLFSRADVETVQALLAGSRAVTKEVEHRLQVTQERLQQLVKLVRRYFSSRLSRDQQALEKAVEQEV